ncbi:glycerol-3-phosphate 1-O-acyltransferase PlsY [Chenggangzhangella methanolivorans]|uniref:Glycerol-3-phosphate acyltransferase n=1 Tax=Chenggangzhangella methanolivorans TaxID=1437009 RepID=A0A9E6RB31_9HYPH|nr:glycerol-3-phosphate 1-O-acyltransferase PlsY [Chenggangzhangella methanolivorans]QZN99952.1 glycerol-3-phosphate 1-O-acyltransferase PlsY [Chenggangzhangella methanolivorans]
MTDLLLSALIGYLLGSIPFGVIVTRLGGAGDLRKIGSGNIGTTNVLRTGRKELAAATLLGDMLKATVAVLVARHFWGETAGLVGGAAAFLGHVFPVWLKFKGGKGVATYLGALIGVFWPVALAFAGVWIAVAKITKYSSASALAASLCAPLLLAIFVDSITAIVFAGLSIALWQLHHENIGRLMAGEESRIGEKSAAPDPQS